MPTPDEHESAAAAWLDSPSTQREIAIIRKRFPAWQEYQVVSFALQVAIMVDLNLYGAPEPEPDDDEFTEPWERP